MGALEQNTTLIHGIHLRESADDGSDFSNAASDYRVLFLGEDGFLHVKDSAGTVTDAYDTAGGGGAPTDAEYIVTAAHASLSAEKVVFAPATGGSIPKIVRKTSDETVNNSASLQDDDALLFAIGASEAWLFEFSCFYDTGTTPDIKFAITCPASPTLIYWTASGLDATGGMRNDSTTQTSSGSSTTHDGQGSGTIRHTTLKGIIVNGANAGNVTLQWAQNTANGSNTIVKAGSYLMAWRQA